MPLIASISGIRGTIGGLVGEGFTPMDVVSYTAAFGTMINEEQSKSQSATIVIGRDARVSGLLITKLVAATLQSLGIDVVDLGLSTTPTVEIAVVEEKAQGGIIITASHNPANWNALKLLNNKGEFISDAKGKRLLSLVSSHNIQFAESDKLGIYNISDQYIDRHIELILSESLVDREAINGRRLTVVIDCVNSTGGMVLPKLLKKLGVEHVIEINCDATGIFAHDPEPLEKNMQQIMKEVKNKNADLGIIVDPDVDRLAFVCENGEVFGEEYTLVAVADYILGNFKNGKYNKVAVSNLSSSRALRDVAKSHGAEYYCSAVGEVNVVNMMKEVDAVIGGEGNGGIIFPGLHYGRDALVGIGLFLSHFAKTNLSMSALRAKYPAYFMSKKKIELSNKTDISRVFSILKQEFSSLSCNTVDGLKIDFENEWVHLRPSNTEPIVRIYTESTTIQKANALADQFIKKITEIINQQ